MIHPNVSNRIRSRRGIQLLELLISVTVSSMLVAGVSASIFMAAQGRDIASQGQSDSELWMALDRFANDVAEANDFISCSDQSVVMTVPDRDVDGNDEILEYSWTSGAPLSYSSNGNAPIDLTDPLDNVTMNWRQSAAQSIQSSAAFDPAGQYLFQRVRSKSGGTGGFLNSDSGTDIDVSIPQTFQVGDLLVAAAVVKGQQNDSITINGWNKIFEINTAEDISLAAFYSTTTTATQVNVNWPNVGDSYAAIAHFTVPATATTLDAFDVNSGNSISPTAPSAIASKTNALVLRLIGTRQTYVEAESTNMPEHFPIVFRSRAFTGPALGIAFKSYDDTTSIPTADFGLTEAQDFATATIVFSP